MAELGATTTRGEAREAEERDGAGGGDEAAGKLARGAGDAVLDGGVCRELDDREGRSAGVVAGDVLIASVLQNETDNDNGGLSDVTATGWTLVDGRSIFAVGTANGDNAWYGTVLYRVADGTEGSSFAFALPNSRADMAIALTVLSERMTNLRISGQDEWLPDSGNTGPVRLPIGFDKR
jgi:hypothetical protein